MLVREPTHQRRDDPALGGIPGAAGAARRLRCGRSGAWGGGCACLSGLLTRHAFGRGLSVGARAGSGGDALIGRGRIGLAPTAGLIVHLLQRNLILAVWSLLRLLLGLSLLLGRLAAVLRPRSGGLGAVSDDREGGSYLHGVALLNEDLLQRAGRGGGDLRVDLVRRDLDQKVVGFDLIALLLQPLRDRALDDRLAKLRHLDLGSHATGPPCPRSKGLDLEEASRVPAPGYRPSRSGGRSGVASAVERLVRQLEEGLADRLRQCRVWVHQLGQLRRIGLP